MTVQSKGISNMSHRRFARRISAGLAAVGIALTGTAIGAGTASAKADAISIPSGPRNIGPVVHKHVDAFARHFASGGTFSLGTDVRDAKHNAGEQWFLVDTGQRVGEWPVVFVRSVRKINGHEYNLDTENTAASKLSPDAIGTSLHDGSATQQWVLEKLGDTYSLKNVSKLTPGYLGYDDNGGTGPKFRIALNGDRTDFELPAVS
ncbi:hypothetical protein ACQPXM_11635 [Kribbella sp. CA-253562]|uniref:hypothetical protein n=1 Tax=Kribbella sp. CA-253562 TaxID=3239942 RepID=UPI003D91512C